MANILAFENLSSLKRPIHLGPKKSVFFRKLILPTFFFKRSKYSSAYRFGFSVSSSSKWSFAQVHRIKTQNVVLSVIIGEKVLVSVSMCQ